MLIIYSISRAQVMAPYLQISSYILNKTMQQR